MSNRIGINYEGANRAILTKHHSHPDECLSRLVHNYRAFANAEPSKRVLKMWEKQIAARNGHKTPRTSLDLPPLDLPEVPDKEALQKVRDTMREAGLVPADIAPLMHVSRSAVQLWVGKGQLPSQRHWQNLKALFTAEVDQDEEMHEEAQATEQEQSEEECQDVALAPAEPAEPAPGSVPLSELRPLEATLAEIDTEQVAAIEKRVSEAQATPSADSFAAAADIEQAVGLGMGYVVERPSAAPDTDPFRAALPHLLAEKESLTARIATCEDAVLEAMIVEEKAEAAIREAREQQSAAIREREALQAQERRHRNRLAALDVLLSEYEEAAA